MQARQIMAELRIVCLDRIRLRLVVERLILSAVIVHIGIRFPAIAVILRRVWRLIHHVLQEFKGALQRQGPTHNTARRTIDCRYKVNTVFFVPAKVYSSSNSVTSLLAGCGGVVGNWACCSVIQLAIVW